MKKKKIIIVALIMIFIMVFVIKFFSYDGMSNTGVVNTYYRVYTKKTGWSKWKKNGKIAGNKKEKILNIEIRKIKNQPVQIFTYDGIWKQIDKEQKNIKMIKIANTYEILEKYQTCYRTYNARNGWLNWTCDSDTPSGTITEDITAIEIKTIPKGVTEYEYLKDYNNNENKSYIEF